MTKLPIFIQKLLLFCLILRGSELIAQNDIIKVRNEATINTAFQEYSPAFYQNGLIFIASNPAVTTDKKEDSNTGKATTSLFFATRNAEGVLQKPAPFAEELTTKFYDGPLSFNNEGSVIYFTRSNLKKGKPVKAKDGLVKLKIYSAEKKDNKWVNIQELPFNSAEFDCEHPSVSSDGRRLYFSSNRPGGFGGMDLYVSTFINNKWSDPVNLGPKINTDKNEIFPFSHPDGKVIFASNGHEGIGNLDIFYTMKTDTGWVYPRILPEPINSRSDDFGLIVSSDKKLGYFSSNRASGNGDDDIFSVDFTNLDAETIFPKIDTRIASPEDLAGTTTESQPEPEPIKVETPVAEAPKPVVTIEKPAAEAPKVEKQEVAKVEEKAEVPSPSAPQEPTAAEAMDILKNKVKAEIAKSENNPVKNEAPIADAPIAKTEPKPAETNVPKPVVKPVEKEAAKPVAEVKIENKKKGKKDAKLPSAANTPLSNEPVKAAESAIVVNNQKKELSPKEKKKAENAVVVSNTEPQFDESTVKITKDTTSKIAKLDDGGFEERAVVISSNEATVVHEPVKTVEAQKPVETTEIKTEIKVAEKPTVVAEAIAVIKIEEKPSIEPVKTTVDSEKTSSDLKPKTQTNLVAATEPAKKEEKPTSVSPVITQDKLNNKFLVVVGTYSLVENANIQKIIAEKKGFDETEIIQYSDTRLFGVCVKQFDNERDAQALVRSISTKKGLEAFVKVLK